MSARVGKNDLADSILIIKVHRLSNLLWHNQHGVDQRVRGNRKEGWGWGGFGGWCDNNMNNLVGLQGRQEVARDLHDCHQQSDLFSEYINQVILRAPLVYVFINIILVIWIAQTIFSSHLNAIPNSLYYLSPLLAARPFISITVLPLASQCPLSQLPIPLKSLPTIYSNHISHQEIFGWDSQPIHFCGQVIRKDARGNSCREEDVLCSGYCVKTPQDCPITKLIITTQDTPLDSGYEEIYLSPQGKSYRISRVQGVPIVAISAAYATKCANDEHYSEAFNNQQDFWKKAEDCGQQGSISEFFTQIDQMDTNTFFAANHIGITTTNTSMMEMALGVVSEFHLANDPSKGCGVAEEWAENVKKYFTAAAPTPQFSGVLTGFSFVLLIANLLWLLGYYNIPQWMGTMNIITLGIAIIQQVIVGFIYSNNVELFQLQKVTQTLRECLQEQITALKEWEIGMQSPQAFQMLLFINTAYLGLHISALLFNHFCMLTYRRQQVLLPLPQPQSSSNHTYHLSL